MTVQNNRPRNIGEMLRGRRIAGAGSYVGAWSAVGHGNPAMKKRRISIAHGFVFRNASMAASNGEYKESQLLQICPQPSCVRGLRIGCRW